MSKGRFVTFEGGEGAGKTTQIRRLVERLERVGIDAIATREPGGSPGAEAIRAPLVSGATSRWDPTTEAMLMLAARRDHWLTMIEPALVQGRWVLSDRFHDSTVAYQGYGRGVPLAEIETLRRIAVPAAAPDLTLILDLPVEQGLARAHARAQRQKLAEDRFERMELDFHERLRAGFHAIARAEPQRCVIVDASGTIDAVEAGVAAAITARLGVRL
jgi:dTMP kinase